MVKKITTKEFHDNEGNIYLVEKNKDSIFFRPGAYGIIFCDNTILLLPGEEGSFKGYDVPGGGIDEWETPQEGLVREFKEETGLDVQPKQLIAVESDFRFIPKKQKGCNKICLCYYCKVTGGDLSKQGFTEYEQEYCNIAQWVQIDQLEEIRFIKRDINMVPIIQKAWKVHNTQK